MSGAMSINKRDNGGYNLTKMPCLGAYVRIPVVSGKGISGKARAGS